VQVKGSGASRSRRRAARIRGAEGVKQIVHAIRKSEGAAPCERVGRWDGGEQESGRGIPAERGKESSSSQTPNPGGEIRRSFVCPGLAEREVRLVSRGDGRDLLLGKRSHVLTNLAILLVVMSIGLEAVCIGNKGGEKVSLQRHVFVDDYQSVPPGSGRLRHLVLRWWIWRSGGAVVLFPMMQGASGLRRLCSRYTLVDPEELPPEQTEPHAVSHRCAVSLAKSAQFFLSKDRRKQLICEEECLDGGQEAAIPDRCVSGAHRESGDSSAVAVRALPAQKEHLQATKTDADRHQERWVRSQPDRYRE
jgi:hypothetical protein